MENKTIKIQMMAGKAELKTNTMMGVGRGKKHT